jgi:hypothetical protein
MENDIIMLEFARRDPAFYQSLVMQLEPNLQAVLQDLIAKASLS